MKWLLLAFSAFLLLIVLGRIEMLSGGACEARRPDY